MDLNYSCPKLSPTNMELPGLSKLAIILIPLVWDQTGDLLVLGQPGEHLEPNRWNQAWSSMCWETLSIWKDVYWNINLFSPRKHPMRLVFRGLAWLPSKLSELCRCLLDADCIQMHSRINLIGGIDYKFYSTGNNAQLALCMWTPQNAMQTWPDYAAFKTEQESDSGKIYNSTARTQILLLKWTQLTMASIPHMAPDKQMGRKM